MDADHFAICAGCEAPLKQGHPFCPLCGTLSPHILNTGEFSLVMQDVPGERSRAHVMDVLRAWFPNIDAIRAAERLRSSWQILVRGVDEDSAQRLADALKKLKVDSRLVREEAKRSWKERLLNPGLAGTVGCVLLSCVLGGIAAIVLLPLGMAAPFIWAILAARRQEALLTLDEPTPRYEKWWNLAKEYARVVRELGSQDQGVVRNLCTKIFDLQHRLSSGSLSAMAAGEDRGDLHARLTEALYTALNLGRRISASNDEEQQKSVRQELVALEETISTTSEWFRELDEAPSKEPKVLDGELHEIIQRVDRILGQVRHGDDAAQRPRKTIGA